MRPVVYAILAAALAATVFDFQHASARQSPRDIDAGRPGDGDEGDYVRVRGHIDSDIGAISYDENITDHGRVVRTNKKVLVPIAGDGPRLVLLITDDPGGGALPFPDDTSTFTGRLGGDGAGLAKEVGVPLPAGVASVKLDGKLGAAPLWPDLVVIGWRAALLALLLLLPRLTGTGGRVQLSGGGENWTPEPGPGKPRVIQALYALVWSALAAGMLYLRFTGDPDGDAFLAGSAALDLIFALMLLGTDSTLSLSPAGVILSSGVTGSTRRLLWEDIATVNDRRTVTRGVVSHRLVFVLKSGGKAKFSVGGLPSDKRVAALEQRFAASSAAA